MTLRIGPYELRRKIVRLRGKESPIYEPRRDEVVIYYFVNTQPHPAPAYQVVENVRYRTIADEQVAAAFVNIGGVSAREAARIVAAHKAAVEGLSPVETANAYIRLLYRLLADGPEQPQPPA